MVSLTPTDASGHLQVPFSKYIKGSTEDGVDPLIDSISSPKISSNLSPVDAVVAILIFEIFPLNHIGLSLISPPASKNVLFK